MSEIIIIGGGIVGSAAAYFLAAAGCGADVTVIEPDPTYGRATTPAGAGGVRCLMSRPENIQMSLASREFYAAFNDSMATEDHQPEINFRRQGYLFLGSPKGAGVLEQNYQTQQAEGVDVELLDVDALNRRFPSINTDNVALACHSPSDGWIDPQSALTGFRKKAESLGVTYVKDRVVGLETVGGKVIAANLESGATIKGDQFINTAGPWVAEIARMIGAVLPIQPWCRVQHFWKCNADIESLPLVKDESGSFFRPEGDGYAGGCPSWQVEPGFIWDWDRGYFAYYFEETVWPLLAAMVPKFEAIKMERTWGGHYAQNTLDGNMIIGRFSEFENIITACGFSGHGIMHAPAVGRALMELVTTGGYQTIELARLEFQRVLDNAPYPELGIR